MNKNAIIILHEIYGINDFIEGQRQRFTAAGFDVVCPDLTGGKTFSYENSQEAYEYFMERVGFDVYEEIIDCVGRLKETYEKVFILGFSAGATVAWRCCESGRCDGIIACYGSRIRDYTGLRPACPVLLIFAKEDSFDVAALVCSLRDKTHVEIRAFNARHGFMDAYSSNYDPAKSDWANRAIEAFFTAYSEGGNA